MKKTGVLKIIGNKFVIAFVMFAVWIVFFDENSIVANVKNKRQLEELKQQKEYYQNRIASDKQKLQELNKGKEELEKFAREQYYMSKQGEDVFVVVEEKEK